MAWHLFPHSTNVHGVNYSPDEKTLLVRFKQGGKPGHTYKYKDVPHQLYDDLIAARSPGGFLREKVFPGRKFEKVA